MKIVDHHQVFNKVDLSKKMGALGPENKAFHYHTNPLWRLLEILGIAVRICDNDQTKMYVTKTELRKLFDLKSGFTKADLKQMVAGVQKDLEEKGKVQENADAGEPPVPAQVEENKKDGSDEEWVDGAVKLFAAGGASEESDASASSDEPKGSGSAEGSPSKPMNNKQRRAARRAAREAAAAAAQPEVSQN